MLLLRNIIVTLVVIGLVAACIAYFTLRNGLAADRPPGRVETAVARRLVVLAMPSSARSMTNPNASQADAWRDAADHFDDHCAVCHGSDGRGHSEFGNRMYPPVPDLSDPAIQGMSDGALFSIIQNGVRWTGMPAFRQEHTEDETWKLVSFVRHVPQLTPSDVEEHEHQGHHRHGEPGEPGGAATSGAHGHGANTIAMDGTSFEPSSFTVKVGGTVTFTNKDPFPHNVVSKTGGFRSGDVDSDQSWQFHATKPGTFPYVCTLHPGMKGTIIVKE
jgi:plastocyanin/mono/diheme cytochrome c family protein